MKPFEKLVSVAAYLPEAKIDTDVIFPARFLLLLDKAGLGRHLFNDRRFDAAGAPRPEFILNQAPFDQTRILIAGPDFGSGSSREHAVWALADHGIRCVIAPSFGEIFFSNCFKNGVLPVRVEADIHARMLAAARAEVVFTVDLVNRTLSFASERIAFEVEDYRRQALLDGLDEIGLVLAKHADEIESFERRWRNDAPWLALGDRTMTMLGKTDHE